MPVTKERLHYLLKQYAANNCTRRELLALLEVIAQGKQDEELKQAMDLIWTDLDGVNPFPEVSKAKIYHHIVHSPKTTKVGVKKLWYKIAAAAAVVVVMANVYWFNSQQGTTKKNVSFVNTQYFENDVNPGGNKAVLILADGKKVILNEAENGVLAKQGNVDVVKHKEGQLAYINTAQEAGAPALYNTIATPNGGQYQLTLADGTEVWLNAASTIKYPTTFNGKERNVEISGEAYFEVAHRANQPFKVKVNTQSGEDGGIIEVLGTHFNINAYQGEEAIKTSLLEGKVKIYKGNNTALLSPGKQASVLPNGDAIAVRTADIDQVMGWKNGYFVFLKSDIQTVMRQLSRWYDVDVRYEGKVTQDKFGGSIPRNATLGQVLRTLEESMVHFKIKGKTVIVTD